LDFEFKPGTVLWQKMLTGHRLLRMAKNGHRFLENTESQKNRLLSEQ